MKIQKLLLTMMLTAAMSSAPLDAAAPARGAQVERWSHPIFRLGQDYRLPAGASAREVVVVFGNVVIEGRVDQNVVVVFGTVQLADTARIGDSLIVVGGNTQAAANAIVDHDLVVVGGGFEAAPGFSPGSHFVIGANAIGGRLEAIVPWLTRGLMWGRPIVPDLGWVWWIVFVFFLVYLAINLVFDRPVSACAATLGDRPLTTFIVGLLVLLLTGPVCLLLTVSVVGIAVVPFVICALFIAAIIGKVGVARWIGGSVLRRGEDDNRLLAATAFAIGFAIITIGYMVPVLGFVVWTVMWVLGMGASALAFMAAYRRENPLPVKPVPTPKSPFDPGPSRPADDVSISPMTPDSSASAAFRTAEPGPVVAGQAYEGRDFAAGTPLAAGAGASDAGAAVPPFSAGPASLPGAPAASLLSYPFAAFADRAAAFVLDLILVMIVRQILEVPRHDEGGITFLMLLAYHIGFWAWKGTTVGGIICQLRIVRIDGSPLRLVDALVRGLSSIFSLVVLGIGVLWILRDPERQAWHDKIAGTYVVKVPRNYPI